MDPGRIETPAFPFFLHITGLSLMVFFTCSGAPSLMAQPGMDYLRTPEARFENLAGYDFEPHYVFVDDYEGGQLRMHYIDEGPVSGPTVLMIHGNPTWVYQFRHVILPLNAAGYRTIAVDLIGMGRSDKPAAFDDYTYDRHVGWVSQLFAQLDSALELGSVVIFGHDYGTPIGIRLMNEYFPDRFDAFINANASLPDGTFISPVHLNWRQFVRDNPDVPVGHVISSQLNEPLTAEERYAYYAPWPDSAYKSAIRSFPEMVPESPDAPEALANRAAWSYIEGFAKPFMTIFGQADLSLFDARRDFIERVPGAYGQPHPQLKVRHYAPEDDPNAVATETLTFLDDLYHPDTFTNLQYDEFETGFGQFVAGGEDCSWNADREAVRIQGNNGAASSLVQALPMDLRGYDVLKVAFRYEAEGLETGEAFVLELWDGSGWINILTLLADTDFANGVWDYGFARIETDSISFAPDARIRLRCAASNSDDAVYIRDIGLYARGEVATNVARVPSLAGQINVFPNPSRAIFRIVLPADSRGTFSILNAAGREVLHGIFQGPDLELNLSAFPAGNYYLRLKETQHSRQLVKPLIKQ
jgi:haloalkane dehalogenase